MPHRLIDNQNDLDKVCRQLAGEEVVGVDTEFLRVRTYFPRLALVQVSAADGIHCIDPLVGELDFDGLWKILADSSVLKVMHAARQDIEVLLHTAGVMPAPLFDTQIAAGLLGHGEQVGYAGLVKAEFGEILPKGSQRTDWTKRPLSNAQIGYAENDVRYLLPLHNRLRRQLESLDRLQWAQEDFERVLDPALYHTEPADAYRRVGRGAHLKPDAQHRLQRLCAWRERTARNRNLPRHWVVDDETLVSLARIDPPTVEDLSRIEGLRQELVDRDGETILACLSESVNGAEAVWSKKESLSAEQKTIKTELVNVLKDRARDLGIAESVILTRAEIEKLVRGAAPRNVISGWRWRVVGEPLSAVLRDGSLCASTSDHNGS